MKPSSRMIIAKGLLVLSSGFLCADLPPNSPSGVVKDYYLAIGSGDLKKVRSFYSSQAAQFFQSQPPVRRAAMESGKTVTFGDTITTVDVTKENIQGDKAWVNVLIHYAHHEDARFSAGVVREDGTWKIATD